MGVYKEYRTCQSVKAIELGNLHFWWVEVVPWASKASDSLGTGPSFRKYILAQ